MLFMVHLLPRFPPEMTRQGGLNNVPLEVQHLCCPALFHQQDPNDANFGPLITAAVLPVDTEGYYHNDTVNAFDVVMAPRNTADTWSVVRLGRWDNAAEILTGLNIMFLQTPSVSVSSKDSHLESTRSILFKGRAARAMCETIKEIGGLANAPAGIADPALNIDQGKWQEEVNGNSNSLAAMDVVYSLAVNLAREGYNGTMTGSRSSAVFDAGHSDVSMAPDDRFDKLYVQFSDRGGPELIREAYVPRTSVEPSLEVRRMLSKIDLTQVNMIYPFLNSATNTPIPQAQSILVGRIHSGFTEAVAVAGGWGGGSRVRRAGTRSGLFGWGIRPIVREWDNTRDVLIPLAGQLRHVFTSGQYGAPMQLVSLGRYPTLLGTASIGYDVNRMIKREYHGCCPHRRCSHQQSRGRRYTGGLSRRGLASTWWRRGWGSGDSTRRAGQCPKSCSHSGGSPGCRQQFEHGGTSSLKPDILWTYALFKESMEEVCSELRHPCCAKPAWNLPLTKYDKTLLRYHLGKHKDEACCTWGRGNWRILCTWQDGWEVLLLISSSRFGITS